MVKALDWSLLGNLLSMGGDYFLSPHGFNVPVDFVENSRELF